MQNSKYVPEEIVQGLLNGIALQARKDYIDASIALKKGREAVHNRPAMTMILEIEAWVRDWFDEDTAEMVIANLKTLEFNDRYKRLEQVNQPGRKRKDA